MTKSDVLKKQDYKCKCCGKPLTDKESVIEHLMPKGGAESEDVNNIIAVCATCNSAKNNKRLEELFEAKKKEDNQKAKAYWWSLAIGITGLLVTVLAALFGQNLKAKYSVSDTDLKTMAIMQQVELQRKELEVVKRSLTSADHSVAKIPNAQVEGRLKALEQKVGKIDEAIMNDPAKALSTIVLSKDVENNKLNFEKRLNDLERLLQKIYDIGLSFIGLSVTVFLAVIGYVINMLQLKYAKDGSKSK
jgi:hypothetical protein